MISKLLTNKLPHIMTMQKNKIKIPLLALLLFSVLVGGCNIFKGKTKESQAIQPPVVAANIPFNEYLIHNDSSITIKLSTGTAINVQPGIFEREDGNPIEGPITLKVREFHSAYDILRSGIPMSINSSQKDFLQSAGMIELRANNNGNELKVKEGKQIEIALAGYNLSNGYDLYYTSDGSSWSQTGRFVSDSNYQRNNRIKELSIIPKVPTDTVDMGKDLIFSLKADLTEVPYLKPFSNLQWRVSKKDISPKVIDAIRIIWDEVSIKQIKGNKLENELVFKRKQFDTSGNQIVQQLVVKASPIVGGKNNREDRKLFAQQMDMYKNTLAKIEEEKARLAKEADMLNSFTISKMGIWNIDKIMKRDDLILVNASFDFEKEINRDINKLKVFVIYEDDNSVIPYASVQWNKIGIRPNSKVSLVAVLLKNELAVITSDELQRQLRGASNSILFATKRVSGVDYLKKF